MKPPGITLGGFYFPVLKRWKNGRALSEFGHSGQACNGFGRTMHVGGFGGRNAPIPGGVWGLVRQGNPWGEAGGYWRRRDCLARVARADQGRHPGDGQFYWEKTDPRWPGRTLTYGPPLFRSETMELTNKPSRMIPSVASMPVKRRVCQVRGTISPYPKVLTVTTLR